MNAGLLVLMLGSPLPPVTVGGEKPAPDLRVGMIIIEGNVRTLDGDILEELNLYPGQRLPGEADILRAEMRLLMTFHKRFDLADRQRPRVEFERNEPDSNFVDIRVRFPEKKRKKDKP
jgi:hypothetical protein